MILYDAFAILALFTDHPHDACEEVRGYLHSDTEHRLASLNLAEVIDQAVRLKGWSYESLDTGLALLESAGLAVVPADESIAREAGRLRANNYRKQACAVSLADCVAIATSKQLGADLATSDPPMARVARDKGVKVLALPDSRGQRP